MQPKKLDIITKVLAGEASEQEIKNLETWLQKNPDNLREFNQMSELWKNIILSKAYDPDYIQASYLKLEKKINGQKNNNIRVFRLYQKIAVAILIFIIVTFVFFSISRTTGSYFTEGNKQEVKLPDNSIVVLNNNTELKYTHNPFGIRKVQFSGEAFFKVKHDQNIPFVIFTGQTKITVLGTSFYVITHKTGKKTNIKVTSGTVKISSEIDNNKHIILKKGECGEVDVLNNEINKYVGFDANSVAWNTGKLVFKSTKLKDVFIALENTYNLDIRLNNPDIEQLTFTGTFNQTKITDILETISKTFNLEMKKNRNEKEIIFYLD